MYKKIEKATTKGKEKKLDSKNNDKNNNIKRKFLMLIIPL